MDGLPTTQAQSISSPVFGYVRVGGGSGATAIPLALDIAEGSAVERVSFKVGVGL
jgi:hypothetical protein